MSLYSTLLLAIAAIAAACGQLLFKIGADGKTSLSEFLNVNIFIGLVLYAIGMAIWFYSLSFEKLVSVYTFTALTFVFVYLGAVFVLGESLRLLAITGIALVLAGIYLIISAAQ